MPKILITEAKDGSETIARFYCPACKIDHSCRVDSIYDDSLNFDWNKNVERPTFRPPIVFAWPGMPTCHSLITDGKIQFLNDCTHELSGQTVEIPEYGG